MFIKLEISGILILCKENYENFIFLVIASLKKCIRIASLKFIEIPSKIAKNQ